MSVILDSDQTLKEKSPDSEPSLSLPSTSPSVEDQLLSAKLWLLQRNKTQSKVS